MLYMNRFPQGMIHRWSLTFEWLRRHAVDSMLRLHPLVPMAAHERPPRSMSIYRRRTSVSLRDAAAAALLHDGGRPRSGPRAGKRQSQACCLLSPPRLAPLKTW